MAAHPERDEWPFEDETHLATNPHLSRVWPRVGQQPTVPAAGTNRRLTVFGSVEAQGRGRIELLTVQQDAVGFARSLAALEARHAATGRDMILVLDNGPCHGSRATQRALAARAAWLEVIHGQGRVLVHTLPERAVIDTPVQEQLIVELYSK